MPSPLAQAGLAVLLSAAAPPGSNPLVAPWTGPYGGVPPFDRVRVEQFEPALEAGMAEQLANIDKITADAAPATFANTVAALERSDRALKRVLSVYDVWSSTMNTPEFQAVETEMAPKLAAFRDRITQNAKLFDRIAAVYDAREKSDLTPEHKRLTWLHYTEFVRAGAQLSPEGKKRVSEINQRLASLFTKFSQNVLADENDYVLFLETERDLAGLPDSFRSAAAAAAEERGRKGQWAVTNTRSSVEPFLSYSDRRDLREKAWRAFVSRGDNGDAKDNNRIVIEILALRAERAKLLGYETHAHWRLENTMAKTPERAMALLEAV
jgi:peptidyl-dipeptidase Dcp